MPSNRSPRNEPRSRLLDAPPKMIDGLKHITRVAVVMDILQGHAEDEIYQRQIDTMISAARSEGCDESDVEVIAAQARRDVADTLAECRSSKQPDLVKALARMDH